MITIGIIVLALIMFKIIKWAYESSIVYPSNYDFRKHYYDRQNMFVITCIGDDMAAVRKLQEENDRKRKVRGL
jgi:hypothetical protein